MVESNSKRNCRSCDKPLRGRSDKKFCNDHCRNTFNNQVKYPSNNLVRNINHVLGRNRRILESILDTRGETARTNKETLQQMSFQFKYLTHTQTTRNGKTYIFCYDHGYLPLDNESYLVVRRKEG